MPTTCTSPGWSTTLAVIVVGLVAWIAVAMVAGLLAHHDLTVSRVGDDLRLRRGLLDRREVSVPAERVQMARVTHHPVLRLFGLVAIRLDSAGGQSTIDATHLTVPVLTPDEADRILLVALPEAAAHPALEPAPRRALRRSLLRSTRGVVLPLVVVLALLRPPTDWVIGVLLVGACSSGWCTAAWPGGGSVPTSPTTWSPPGGAR